MKRLAIAGALAAACGSPAASPAVDGADAAPGDAASHATLDAAGDATVDAGGDAAVDASPDSTIDAGPPGPVQITVHTGGQVAVGVPVVFLAADDAEVATVMTDALGVARAEMAAGGSVNVVRGTAGGFRYVTSYLGVEPGDRLVYGDRDPQVRSLDVRLPVAAGANVTYTVQMSCGGGSNLAAAATVRVLTGCTASDVYVSARQGVNPYADYGAFFVPAVPLPATGPLDLTGHSYVAATAVAQQLTSVPSTIAFADAAVRVHAGARDVWLAASSGASVVHYGGALFPTASISASIPTIGATELLVETSYALRTTGSAVAPVRVTEVTAATSAYALDLATVTTPILTTRPVLDGAGGRVTWSQSPGGTAQWVWADLRIRRAGQSADACDRDVIAPYTAGQVRVPRLPAAFADANVAAGDTATPLFLQVGSSPGGYRAMRPVIQTFGGQVGTLRGPGDRLTVSSMPTP